MEKFTVKYYEGVGRRKTTIARVRVFESREKEFVVNGKPVDHFYPTKSEQDYLLAPIRQLQLDEKMGVSVQIAGGGVSGWKDAIVLGIARALVIMKPENKTSLRKAGYITRDARAVERKKTGLKKARKAPRFSKR